MEVPENEGEENEHHHNDRTETAPYCEKKLRALYENGLKVTLNTIKKISANTMFHSTIALRTILMKTILT